MNAPATPLLLPPTNTASAPAALEAFAWSEDLATGIDRVDRQHRHLVGIVNRLGAALAAGGDLADADLAATFRELADYARFHFADEERLMREAAVDPVADADHARHHREFVEQLTALWRGRREMLRPAEALHGFLAAWLSFHILGEDREMARRLAGPGALPERGGDARAATLLAALHKLYGVLAMQNRDLAGANVRLEAQVAERTRALTEANGRLARDREELRDLLGRVEETQRQLLQSEKMAAIGQLAAGVAHEINNPVGFVTSNLGTLESYAGQLLTLVAGMERCAADSPDCARRLADLRGQADLDYLRMDIGPLIAESREGLERVTRIVRDLKGFSHLDGAAWQEADLNAGLESTLNVVWNELKYKADVVRRYGDLPPVPCLPAQLNQVFMNLLVNAAQAIPERGVITLRSGVDGSMAWVEVEDTGQGMADAVRQRVFEPFFTTKAVGKGTGLGLSISYDIVCKTHGGRFEVWSTPGRGSRFRLWLPVSRPGLASEGDPTAERHRVL